MSRPLIVKRACLEAMVARRLAGATFVAIAAEFSTDESTTRRAVRRELGRRRLGDPRGRPIFIECPMACRPLLVAEARKLGMRPAALMSELIDLVLRGGLVAAVRDAE